MNIQGLGILICFLGFVVLMAKRWCPMALAYPLMALAIAIIVGLLVIGGIAWAVTGGFGGGSTGGW